MLVQSKNITNISTIKGAFKAVFKNSIFIAFSLFNLFIPFFATMMSALNGPNGTIDVIGVGLSTSFITVFNQFLFLISMITVFVTKQQKESKLVKDDDNHTLWIVLLLYATVAAVLFIATSFLYIHFSTIYWNVNTAITAGYKYIAIIIPSLYFNTFIYFHMFKIFNTHKAKAYMIIFNLFALNLILIPVIGVLIDWSTAYDTFGIGLGISVSSFTVFAILVLFNVKKYIIYPKFNKNDLSFILRKTKNFCLVFLLSTILKSFLVMGIAISLGLSNKPTPPALMIAKIIWYNSLFFVGWFADGLFYSIQYTRITTNKYDVEPNYKIWTSFIVLAGLVTLMISVLFGYISMWLPRLYIGHQTNVIVNPLNIPDGFWPYGTLSYKEVQSYLWNPDQGVANFSLDPLMTPNGLKWQYSKTYALLYVSLYHVIVNSTKIMGISNVEFNQKFNWKGLISNFILISSIMIFIVLFSVLGSHDNETIRSVFPGIDAFSFSLFIIIAFLFILTLLGYIKSILIQHKTNQIKSLVQQAKFNLDKEILMAAINIMPEQLKQQGMNKIGLMIYHLFKKQQITQEDPNFKWTNEQILNKDHYNNETINNRNKS